MIRIQNPDRTGSHGFHENFTTGVFRDEPDYDPITPRGYVEPSFSVPGGTLKLGLAYRGVR